MVLTESNVEIVNWRKLGRSAERNEDLQMAYWLTDSGHPGRGRY